MVAGATNPTDCAYGRPTVSNLEPDGITHFPDPAVLPETEIPLGSGTVEGTNAGYPRARDFSAQVLDTVGCLVHEIRLPMTAILGNIDLLDEGGLGDGPDGLSLHERRQSLRTIRRNAEHLLQLINDILDLSKIEAGRFSVETIICSPIQIISDVAAVMRIRAIEKKIAFQVQYIGPVPQTINTDSTRLRQILINLIGNAIKFTHSGSVRLLVRLLNHNSLDKTQLQFQVVDTGIGMTQQQISSLFKPFTQADSSATRKSGGTGLGLAISKRLAEAMGGGITVDSISGAGTTFTVWIDPGSLADVPLVLDPGEADAAFSNDKRLAHNLVLSDTLAGKRILLAEDGPDNQYLISLLLRRAGAHVTTADTGRSAVALALDATREHRPYELVLMDMQMPELDGYAATRRLRERGYVGKIIALTAHTMPGDRERCLAEGCDDYIPKPFEPMRLIQAIIQAVMLPIEGTFEEPSFAAAPTTTPDPAAAQDALLQDPEYASLLQQYCRTLKEQARDLERALQTGELLVIDRHATALKGSAGGFGFPAISRAAGLVERGVRGGLTVSHLSRAVEDLIYLCYDAATVAGEQPIRNHERSN